MLAEHFVTLKTERLILRAQTMADFEAYRAFMASPRSLGVGGPHDVRDAWGFFCHDMALWQFFGHGGLMIDLAATGECIGQVGINDGPLFPEKELGWFLYDGHEGKGYASEAAVAYRSWAFETLRLPTLVSYLYPDNLRSRAVAERIGARLDPAAPRDDADALVFRHPRPA